MGLWRIELELSSAVRSMFAESGGEVATDSWDTITNITWGIAAGQVNWEVWG